MKKIILLVPMLALLVTGCSLTQKPVYNGAVSDQPTSTSQEQADNLSAQIQDLKKQNSELAKENEAIKNIPDKNVISSTTPIKNEELSNISEKWLNTPAAIKSIYVKNNTTYLSIDILSRNPKFLPGVTDFFINQSTKLREVSVNDSTKSYLCGAGLDGNDTTADVPVDTKKLLATIQKKLSNKEYSTYYFDINNNVVQSIYEQCLP